MSKDIELKIAYGDWEQRNISRLQHMRFLSSMTDKFQTPVKVFHEKSHPSVPPCSTDN